jgi:hypothetical protein
MMHAPLLTVCEFILALWHSVSAEILEKCFKVVGISSGVYFVIIDVDNES